MTTNKLPQYIFAFLSLCLQNNTQSYETKQKLYDRTANSTQ